MSDPHNSTAWSLSPAERANVVLRYWRRGDLTPLRVANSLAQRVPDESAAQPS